MQGKSDITKIRVEPMACRPGSEDCLDFGRWPPRYAMVQEPGYSAFYQCPICGQQVVPF